MISLNKLKKQKSSSVRVRETLSKLNVRGYYFPDHITITSTQSYFVTVMTSLTLAESKKYFKKTLDLLEASEDPGSKDPMQAIF